MRKKSKSTDEKRKKYSWQPYIDSSLRSPAKIAANTARLELREYLSQELGKILFGSNNAKEKAM